MNSKAILAESILMTDSGQYSFEADHCDRKHFYNDQASFEKSVKKVYTANDYEFHPYIDTVLENMCALDLSVEEMQYVLIMTHGKPVMCFYNQTGKYHQSIIIELDEVRFQTRLYWTSPPIPWKTVFLSCAVLTSCLCFFAYKYK